MKYLDLTLRTPAENLACDEALLDGCDQSGDEVLRFWESPEYFVVVGYGNSVDREVNRAACEAAMVPIFRRCSGGGTVVQGRGCLNYSLILKITPDGPLHSITAANRFIMERNREAIESVADAKVQIRGHTDLAIGEIKFSGNSQRRKKQALLFHGCFLLQFDLRLISELLLMPSKQPEYRHNRSHSDFVANQNLPAESVKEALRKIWEATEVPSQVPAVASLVRDKYATPEWNFKF